MRLKLRCKKIHYTISLSCHFIWNICTPTHSFDYLISQSYGNGVVCKIIQIQDNSLGNVSISHHYGVKM